MHFHRPAAIEMQADRYFLEELQQIRKFPSLLNSIGWLERTCFAFYGGVLI